MDWSYTIILCSSFAGHVMIGSKGYFGTVKALFYAISIN